MIFRPRFNRKSFEFDGATQDVVRGSSGTAKALNDAIVNTGTISFWFNIHNPTAFAANSYLSTKPSVYYCRGTYAAPTVTLTNFLYTGTVTTVSLGIAGVSVQAWHNIVFTWDSAANACSYLDGVKKVSTSMAGNPLRTNLEPWVIGSPYYGAARTPMRANNFSIWNDILSDGGVIVGAKATGEIAELYNDGIPQDLNTHSAAANLQLWWGLNEKDSPTVITDLSGNAQNGIGRNLTTAAIVQTTPGF